MYGIDLVKGNSTVRSENKSNGSGDRHQTVSGCKVTTLLTQGSAMAPKEGYRCSCCSESCRDLSKCNRFKSMSLDERTQFVKGLKLCFNCLKGNHFSRKCRKPKSCAVPDCHVKHNTLLHSWVSLGDDNTVMRPSVNCASVRTKAKNWERRF